MEGEKESIVKELSEGLERKVKFLLSEGKFEEFLLRHGFYALRNRAFWKVLLTLYDDLSPNRRKLVLLVLLLFPSSPPSFPEVEEFVFKSLEDVLYEAIFCSVFAPSERVVRKVAEIVRSGDESIKGAFLRVSSVLISSTEVSEELVEVLLEFIEDEDWYVRKVAAEALGEAVGFLCDGNLIRDVVRALVSALEDEDRSILKYVHKAAAEALGKAVKFLRDRNLIRDVVGALVNALGSEDVREVAVEAFKFLREEDLRDVVRALIEILEDEERFGRDVAAEALGRIAKFLRDEDLVRDIVRALLNALEDEDVRLAAAEALGRAVEFIRDGGLIRDVVGALVNALEDESVRLAAAEALGRAVESLHGEDLRDVVRALVEILEDEERFARDVAAEALGRAVEFIRDGGLIRDVVGALVNALEDEDWFVRHSAAEALGRAAEFLRYGDLIRDVVKALVNAFEDKDWSVRVAAVEALGRAVESLRDGSLIKDVVRGLLKALEDEDWSLRGATEAAENAILRINFKDLNFDEIRKVATFFKEMLQSVYNRDGEVQPYLIRTVSRFEDSCGVKLSILKLSYLDAFYILSEAKKEEVKAAFSFVIRNVEEEPLRVGSCKGIFLFFS